MNKKRKRRTYVELAGDGGKAGLTVDGVEDVEGMLLWSFDDDMVASSVPSYHVVVLLLFKETGIGWHKSKNVSSKCRWVGRRTNEGNTDVRI